MVVVFVRRASRFSLAHAFFLFLITAGYGVPTSLIVSVAGVFLESRTLVTLVVMGVKAVDTLVAGCVLAWLLGNFERRDAVFRKRAVLWLAVVLVVIRVVGGLFSYEPSDPLVYRGLLVVGLVLTTLLPLAFAYLVRVRRP